MTNELKITRQRAKKIIRLRAKKVISLKAARKLLARRQLAGAGTRWPKRGTLTVLTGPGGLPGRLFLRWLWRSAAWWQPGQTSLS